MTRVPTYRMEARVAEQEPETWCRGTVSRTDVFASFDALVADDAAGDAPMFGPHTGHRLVVLAEPATSAPLNRPAAADLRRAVPPVIAGRLLVEADQWTRPRWAVVAR